MNMKKPANYYYYLLIMKIFITEAVSVVYRIQKANRPRTKMKVVHIKRLAKYGKRDNESFRDEQA